MDAKKVVGFAALLTGCAAPLVEQSTDTFANTFNCSAERVRAKRADHGEQWYELYDVRGCGYRQIYVCATDLGCVRPGEVAAHFPGGSSLTVPPTLVDQAPPPPQPLPDTQAGGS